MYTILGATGNIGSVITKKLLEKGEKVRVVGRNAARLQGFVQKGAEAFVADAKDASVLTQALTGVRAAFLMVPPNVASPDYALEQDAVSDAITAAVKNSGLAYAVALSSVGGHAPTGTGPIAGLHRLEQKLSAVERAHVLSLRPAYFMENHLSAIGMIQMMGIYGGAVNPTMKIPMIATRDIGAYAAERLLNLDFNGKQTRELLGERDLSMSEATAAIGKGISRPDVRYVQFSYEQVEQTLLQMGVGQKTAPLFSEMFRGFNEGIVVNLEPRSEANTTPTSIESFVKEVFVPAYQGKAVGA